MNQALSIKSRNGQIGKFGSLLIYFCAVSSLQAAFYASPNGSGDCSAGSPCSLQTVISRLGSATDGNSNDVEIFLRGGFYELEEPLKFFPDHSGSGDAFVRIQAYPDEVPILSGGRRVPPDSWVLHDDEKNIYRSYVRPLIEDRRPDLLVMQLYVNGRRATCARGPDNPGLTRHPEGYVTSNPSMASWANHDQIRVRERVRWMSRVCGVESIAPGLITMQQPCWDSCRFFEMDDQDPENQPLKYIENAYELLDEPGEWHLNRVDGMLYYIPRLGENMADGNAPEVVIPVLDTIVEIGGEFQNPVRNIHFKDLVFAHATWFEPGTNIGFADVQGEIYLREPNWETGGAQMPANNFVHNARNIIFERNVFAHMGAIGLQIYTGSRDVVLKGNIFEDISGSGIFVGSLGDWSYEGLPGDLEDWVVTDTRIENNLIRRTGSEYGDSLGIAGRYPRNTTIAHNLLTDLPGMGIHIGGGHGEADAAHSHHNHIVANEIHNVMVDMQDGGFIYVDDANRNSTISGNYMHGNGDHAVSCGLYLEDGSQFWRSHDNVFADLRSGTAHVFIDYVKTPSSNNIVERHYVQENVVNCHDSADPPCRERNIIRDIRVHPDKCWPAEALAIIENAGLEPDFKDLLVKPIP